VKTAEFGVYSSRTLMEFEKALIEVKAAGRQTITHRTMTNREIPPRSEGRKINL
jgi:hypothetical protein